MTTQKEHLKAMIGSLIEKDDDKAAVELHAYLATKMQDAVEKAVKTVQTSDE